MMAKRFFDLSVAFFFLVFFSIPMIFLAMMVRRKLGSPVLFIQTRPGQHGKPFRMLKFRTMLDAVDQNGDALPDEMRLTSFGRFLRSTSLDELPELWNVLKGDMSLVGPRPLLMDYLPLYSPAQMRRHDVRPGITGLAQINGRNAISWERKFALDIWYIKNRNFILDLRILILTLRKVTIREGISSAESATMPKFTGNRDQKYI